MAPITPNDWMEELMEGFTSMFKTATVTKTVEDNTSGTYRNGPDFRTTKDATGMTLVIDMPGVDPADLKVEAEGESVIVVSGKRDEGKSSFTARYRFDDGYSTFAARGETRLGQLHIRVFTVSPFVSRKSIPIDIK
jgi:HSP20 family molecular chaperone IbpA